MNRLPRTIRLDPSDGFVFARAASAGEWAVSGGFVFAGADRQALSPKALVAMRSGFLGVASLGWSTLVEVAEISDAGMEAVAAMLAARLVSDFGCPDLATARIAAREELEFATGLCDLPPGSIVAVQRSLEDGTLTERFRTLSGRSGPAPVFALVRTDEPAEAVDLLRLKPDGGA